MPNATNTRKEEPITNIGATWPECGCHASRMRVPTVPTDLEVAELSGELRHAVKVSGIEIIAVFLLIFLIFTNCKQYNSK